MEIKIKDIDGSMIEVYMEQKHLINMLIQERSAVYGHVEDWYTFNLDEARKLRDFLNEVLGE